MSFLWVIRPAVRFVHHGMWTDTVIRRRMIRRRPSQDRGAEISPWFTDSRGCFFFILLNFCKFFRNIDPPHFLSVWKWRMHVTTTSRSLSGYDPTALHPTNRQQHTVIFMACMRGEVATICRNHESRSREKKKTFLCPLSVHAAFFHSTPINVKSKDVLVKKESME